jgi:hypothetical protein
MGGQGGAAGGDQNSGGQTIAQQAEAGTINPASVINPATGQPASSIDEVVAIMASRGINPDQVYSFGGGRE